MPRPSTLTASQQAIYLNSSDELFDASRLQPCRAKPTHMRLPRLRVAAPLEACGSGGSPGLCHRSQPEPFRFPLSPGPQPALMPPNLWNLRAKPGVRPASRKGPARPVAALSVDR